MSVQGNAERGIQNAERRRGWPSRGMRNAECDRGVKNVRNFRWGLADKGTMKGDDVAVRLLDYSARVLRVVGQLSRHPHGRYVAGQLARSGTAPGAHYEEARRAESKADFVHKMRIGAKEAGESVYWLRLTQRSGLVDGDLDPLIREGGELTAIFIASIRTASKQS